MVVGTMFRSHYPRSRTSDHRKTHDIQKWPDVTITSFEAPAGTCAR